MYVFLVDPPVPVVISQPFLGRKNAVWGINNIIIACNSKHCTFLCSFCMVFSEQPNMSDPNADFLQPYKKVCCIASVEIKHN